MNPVRTKVSPAGRTKHDVLATPVQYGVNGVQQVVVTDNEGENIQVMMPEMLAERNTDATYVMTNELDEEEGLLAGMWPLI